MFTSKTTDTNNIFWEKITTGQAVDKDIVSLFLARVAAFRNISNEDSEIRETAKRFLLDTMSQSEDEYNFPVKQRFVGEMSFFASPTILAKRSDESLCAIVYKIDCRRSDVNITLHEISFFTRAADGRYKYTHKYDLAELYQRFCKDNVSDDKIRQLGDAVLHKEAKTVISFADENLIEIKRQIDVLKMTLTKTGGVGIAANQCSEIIEPLKIILSGVDYNEPEHVIKAITRYPTVLFPQMKICINPVIVGMDAKTNDFAEGCLSVHGIFRGMVRRPETVIVRYQDTNGGAHEDSLSGSDARVMLHELDHVLKGKVYIQRIIDELTITQCQQLAGVIDAILSIEVLAKNTNPFVSPLLIFERDNSDHVIFNIDKVKACFKDARRDILKSIHNILNEKIASQSISSNTLK